MALEYCRDIENEIGREQVTVIRKIPPKEHESAAVLSAEKEKGKCTLSREKLHSKVCTMCRFKSSCARAKYHPG